MPAAQTRHQIYGETQERMQVIAGGSAGNLTLTGIKVNDKLINVLNLTDGGDMVAEFSITAANTINNSGGTATTGDKLLVRWYDTPAGA